MNLTHYHPIPTTRGYLNASRLRHITCHDQRYCPYCNRPFTFVDPETLEHIIPVALGGPFAATWNITLAHESCNRRKGSKSPNEYLAEIGLERGDFYRRLKRNKTWREIEALKTALRQMRKLNVGVRS